MRTRPGYHAAGGGVDQPRVITALWHRVVDRPLVRALATLAVLDWVAMVVLSALGRAPLGTTAALVFVSIVWWVFVLTWYRALPGLIAGGAGLSAGGARFGQFFEQMGLGLLAGMHAIWTCWLVVLLF